MRIIVKRDRNDLGWVVTKEGQFATEHDGVFVKLFAALDEARVKYPEYEIVVDDRVHSQLGNGMVLIKGDAALMPVEWK